MKLDSPCHILRFLTVSAFLVCLANMPAFAQNTEEGMQSPQASPIPRDYVAPQEQRQSLPPEAGLDTNEVTIVRDNYAGKYNSSTIDNLAKMYWRLGAFDYADDLAIANYIKITDCKVFTDYVNDDMEWRKIVDVMRDHLKQKSATFPLNFQFVIELHLGRYDPDRGGFDLIDNTGFKDSKRIQVKSIDSSKKVCHDTTAIKDYPRSMFILLPSAFTLDFVKLDEHVAQAYILRKKSEYSQLREDQRVKRYERDAYLRLRVSLNQYNGNLEDKERELMGIVYGTIDGYEVFEDSSQKRLMLSVDLKDQELGRTSMMSLPTIEDEREEYVPVERKVYTPNQGIMPVSHSFVQ